MCDKHFSGLCAGVCVCLCLWLPLAVTRRPLQGLNHLGPVSSASPPPPPPSWRPPCESGHSCGHAPSETPARGRMRPDMAGLQSDMEDFAEIGERGIWLMTNVSWCILSIFIGNRTKENLPSCHLPKQRSWPLSWLSCVIQLGGSNSTAFLIVHWSVD